MQNKSAYKQYASVHVSTVDRGKLLLMLYDGCIKFLKHGKAGLEKNDIPKFARFLSKAQAIISELMLTLDFERGGDIARDLDRLYDFMLFYLTEANLEKSPEKIQKVIDLVEVIASAYRDVIEGETKKQVDAGAGEKKKEAGSKDDKDEDSSKKGDPRRGQNLSVAF